MMCRSRRDTCRRAVLLSAVVFALCTTSVSDATATHVPDGKGAASSRLSGTLPPAVGTTGHRGRQSDKVDRQESCEAAQNPSGTAWRAEQEAVRGRVPVAIMHWTMPGCEHCLALPPFLPATIRTAVASGNHVVLVGDEATSSLQGPGVTWIPVAALAAATAPLDAVYQHASSNAESYEKGCMQRPFLLRALARLLGVPRIAHIDSDVLLLTPIEAWLARIEHPHGVGAQGLHGRHVPKP